ncbi:MAG: transcription termination/antitermination protein NusG [Planctomycetota bacterium]
MASENNADQQGEPGTASDAPASQDSDLGKVAGSRGSADATGGASLEATASLAAALSAESETASNNDEQVDDEQVDDLDDVLDEIPEDDGPVEPLEYVEDVDEASADREWYILKVQVNREDSIRDALIRRVKIAKMDRFFGDIIVPTEEVAEFNKNGKRRNVKKKLYPGYLLVHMALNDDTWFVVRETGGIGDFTGSAGKPSIMPTHEVEKILRAMKPQDGAAGQVKTAIPFKVSDRVRVKEGYFLNFEGEISAIDQAHGRVTVMINIFGRPNPVELDHWQIEAV